MEIHSDFSLQRHNTLCLPCRAQHYVCADSIEETQEALAWARDKDLPLTVLGGGSNVVLPERLPGLVLQPAIRGREVRQQGEEVHLQICAGEEWAEEVRRAVEAGHFGIENLALIPGTAGAAPVQNIGAYGVQLQDVLEEVEVLDARTGSLLSMPAGECGFSYRDSIFRHEARDRLVIIALRLRLSRRPAVRTDYLPLARALEAAKISSPGPSEVYREVVRLRQSRLPDPARIPNVGSFFRNPLVDESRCRTLQKEHPELVAYPRQGGTYRIAAGWLLEQTGWRGRRHGAVAVHDQHALVLTNPGRATSAEILDCARAMRLSVCTIFGIDLEIEPRVLFPS